MPGLGIKVVGFLDDFKTNEEHKFPIKILGKIPDFPRIAKTEFFNKIFITIHHDSKDFLRLLEQAREEGIAVRVVPQGFDLVSGEFTKYNIGFIPILEYSDAFPLRKQVGKRLFDFISSFLGLIFLCLVVYAGFLWMTAQGETKPIQKAKDILIGAIVGLLITLSAYIITDWITASLEGAVAIAPFIHSTAISVRDILFS